MLVVADSSPLIVLINIGHVGVLAKLFTKVLIPQVVAEELRAASRPPAVRQFMTSSPLWLEERRLDFVEPIPSLHAVVFCAQEH